MRITSCVLGGIVIACISLHVSYAQTLEETPTTRAQAAYDSVYHLYEKGEYKPAQDLLDGYIKDFESDEMFFPDGLKAKSYMLRGMIVYAFREAGFKEEVERYFLKAIERDLDIDTGDPAKVPPYLINLFSKVKLDYIYSYSRDVKKHTLGLFAALILESSAESGVFTLLQPGVSYTFSLNNNLDLGVDIRFPITWPLWKSLRGQLGFTWFPYFRVENLCLGISVNYMFGLDEFAYYTHSVALSGKGEIVMRSGLGIAASVEVLRLDLLLGYTTANPPAQSRAIDIIENMFRLGFANLNVYIIYNF